MKRMKLSEKLNIASIKRVAALFIALMLLVTTIGCKTNSDDKKNNSSNASNSSSNSSNSSGNNSGTSSDGSSSEDPSLNQNSNDSSAATIDPLKGNINVEYEYLAGTSRTDAEELTPSVDPAGYEQGLKGYREDLREERLNEILNTPNTEELYDLKGEIFYVSTKGSDANDGKSPQTPIQSLAAIDTLSIDSGDAVLFERGCIWRMTETLELKSGAIYGSYGEGRKPMLLGSPRNFSQETWKPSNKKNVWQMNYMYAYPGGMFFDEGKEIGYQKNGLRDLQKNTDFYFNQESATLYLYCDKGNPAKVWKFIEVSQTGISIKAQNNNKGTTVDNLSVRYLGIHSIHSSWGAKNFTVTNCEIGYNGGGWGGGQGPTGGNTRYGNSIESWCGGYGFTTNHNWIYQNFDTAISPQGGDSKKFGDYANISISDNLFEYNNCDIENWDRIGPSGMCLYINNKWDNNIHRFTSLGWGTRPDDGGIRGIDGVHYGGLSKGQLHSISWSNNIIDCPGRQIFKFGISTPEEYKKFIRKGNTYYIRQSIRTTTALVNRDMYYDSDGKAVNFAASTEADTLKAFAKFEPSAKVYWYK